MSMNDGPQVSDEAPAMRVPWPACFVRMLVTGYAIACGSTSTVLVKTNNGSARYCAAKGPTAALESA